LNRIPELSLLNQPDTAFDYVDSYTATLEHEDVTVEEVTHSFFTATPAWVGWLFTLRNNIVKMFGLKISNEENRRDVLKATQYNIGDQLGLFKIFAKNEREILLGEDDKHLDFRVSLYLDKQAKELAVTTVVKFNNWFGRLYFIPVRPFHKMIVPAMLKGIIRRLQTTNNRNQLKGI